MVNMRRQAVSYQPFKASPHLQDGLLPVDRPGGELEAKVASAFFNIADQLADINDRKARREGILAGQQAALAGAPGGISVQGGANGSPMALSGSAADQARTIIEKEEGFVPKAFYDVNANRVGYSSDTVTLPDGSFRRVRAGDTVTRADADRDLSRRIGEFASRASSDVGAENWNRLPDAVQAALLSVSYNYGSLPSSVVRAVKAGNVGGIASAVKALSANPKRRAREASIISSAIGQPAGTDMIETGSIPATAGVDPSVQAPKIVPSTGSGQAGFRPTGRDTIYGRAYDAAGTKTYLEELNSEIESTTQQVYLKYHNDPAKLAEAFDDLNRAMLKDHVFPQIQAEYQVTFDHHRNAYMAQAQRDMEKRAEEQNRADFLSRASSLETQTQQRIEGFDPGNPESAGAVWASQRATEEAYDSAVQHGILDPVFAEKAKEASRRQTAVAFYQHQADGLDADGVHDLHEQMKTDFAAGKLDNIDAGAWKILDAGLGKMERQKRAAGVTASNALAKRGEAFINRAAAGFDIDPGEMGRFMLDAKTAPNGTAIVQHTMKIVGLAQELRDLPIAKAEASVRDMEAKLPANPTAEQIATARDAEKMLAETRKSLATDPLAHAERMRVIPPLESFADAKSPQDFAQIMMQRIDAGDQVAAHFGIAPRFFKAGEVKAIEDAVKADPEMGAQITGAIVSGSGNRVDAVLKAFGKDAPTIAGAGAIIAGGGSAKAAQDAIAGAQADPATGRAYPALPRASWNMKVGAQLGGALALQPDDKARIVHTAADIAKKRIADAGIDAKSDTADAIYDKALDEAAGAVFDGDTQYGGFATIGEGWFHHGYRVLVPNTIDVTRFADVLAALKDSDLDHVRSRPVTVNGRLLPASLLQQYRPVAVKGGFAFSRNDPASPDPKFVYGEDGKLFVLDLDALAPKLAPRVPGAFRGY